MAQGNNGVAASGSNITAETAIEISELDRTSAASIKEKIHAVYHHHLPLNKPYCIYKVHDKFRKTNEYAYKPEIVSIGPFHHNAYRATKMQHQKLRYVKNLVARSSLSLEECLASIRSVEHNVRKCYYDPFEGYLNDSNAFVELMVIDGLFIIELFYKSAGDVKTDKGDPIFNNVNMASIMHDLILLENQIPMLVLSRLFDLVTNNQNQNQNQNQKKRTLAELALHFFSPYALMERKENNVLEHYHFAETIKGDHLLDLFGKSFQDFGEEKKPLLSKLNQKFEQIPCVTELKQAGVKFKRNEDAKSFLDIKFCDGKMSIPPIIIQDQTDSLLRNLIASEQAFGGQDMYYITSYAFLMDSLINSPEDIAILRSENIVTNYLGDNKDVSSLFNKLCSEVTLENFYYRDLCDKVNKYASTPWHTWRASFCRDYCSSPWAGIAVFSACVLLILNFASTAFSGLSYFAPKSN